MLPMGCGLDHQFCSTCVSALVLSELEAGRIPRCPRAVECRYELSYECVQQVLSTQLGGKALEQKLLDWHDAKVAAAQDRHPLLRGCRAADCKGHVVVPRATLHQNAHHGRMLQLPARLLLRVLRHASPWPLVLRRSEGH